MSKLLSTMLVNTKATLYYTSIISYAGGISYYLYNTDYQAIYNDSNIFELVTYGLIATSLPYLLINILGLLLGHPFKKNNLEDMQTIAAKMKNRIFIRIVTRGTNGSLVQQTVNSAYDVLKVLPDNKYHIEVVTDNTNNLKQQPQLSEIVVPKTFKCSTKFKGRALQYALLGNNSKATNNDWIVHLDEESCFDEYTIKNIMLYTMKEEEYKAKNDNDYSRIGQGTITYGQKRVEGIFSQHTINTLADSIRIADDFGRFRFQYSLQTSLFGMKGSYIVIQNSVEKRISFDHGLESSVTEDAFFALYARSKNIKFQFVNGMMYERSPFSMMDFVKQRKRWFIGLWLTCTASKIPLSSRKEMIFGMLMWTLQPISYICILINFFMNFNYEKPDPRALIGFFLNPFLFLYLMGFFLSINFRVYNILEYITLLIFQIVFIPLFSVLEFGGVVYSFLRWDAGFFIVKKETKEIKDKVLESEILEPENDNVVLDIIEEKTNYLIENPELMTEEIVNELKEFQRINQLV